jgi:acyl dehydratase
MHKKITDEQIMHYAEVSGDFAAIHFPGRTDGNAPIVHGMYVMGLAQSLFLQEHPGYWIADYEMKFIRQIAVHSTVSFQFEQKDADVSLFVFGEDGRVCVKGKMKLQKLADWQGPAKKR